MMTSTTDFVPAQELVIELAVALQEAERIPYEQAERYATPIVRYLQQQHGGDELYIPQPYMQRNLAELVAERERGTPVRDIIRKFGISRRTYYRLLSQM